MYTKKLRNYKKNHKSTKGKELDLFANLSMVLKKHGYRIFPDDGDDYRWTSFESADGRIYGSYSTVYDYFHEGDMFNFDCASLFDKPQKCPVKVPMPRNEDELILLLKILKQGTTKKFFDYSNERFCMMSYAEIAEEYNRLVTYTKAEYDKYLNDLTTDDMNNFLETYRLTNERS